MDDGKADILAGIRELRAKAAEQLTGNEYYMIVQQLDSLATNVELSNEVARSVFSLISARLGGSAPKVAAAGGPEVPETPDSPAQPDTPSTPDVPVVPDSPAEPGGSPGPDIPPPPDSPAEPQTPQEFSAAPVAAADAEDRVQVITPSANSFGMPQATVAVRIAETATPSSAPEAAPAGKPVRGLAAAIMAVRALVEDKLSGNSYYSAANLLGQLQMLPPAAGGGEIEAPDGFESALALLRREAAHLSGAAHDEAARVISALENVLMPKPAPEKPAEEVSSQPAQPQPEAAAPEAEPEPRTGFDDLAEAAWRRVQQVSAADPRPAAALNGSAALAVEQAAPAPEATAQPEMMAQDIGEAFDDGGSESRSSEPCYLHEFELAGAQHGASDTQEPAAEAGADAASETEREAALSAEAEALIGPAESGADPAVVVEEAAVEKADILSVEFEEVAEPQASGPVETAPPELPAVAEAEPQAAELEKAAAAVPEQPMPLEELAVATGEIAVPEAEPEALELEPVTIASETAAEEPGPAAVSPPATEEQGEPAAASASGDTVEEASAAELAPEPKAPAAKPVKRGFFGRLFGGASAENGR